MSNLLTVHNPYNRAVIGTLDFHTAADAHTALADAAQLARQPEALLPVPDRLAIMLRAAQLLADRRDTFARLACAEGGKPWRDTLVEVDRAIEGIRTAEAVLRTAHGQELPLHQTPATAGRLAFTSLEPVGAVLAISAFNHPLNLLVHQAIPALAAGAPCLLKPALRTPLTARAFVDLLREAGLPRRYLRLFITPDELTGQLVISRQLSFLTFIGSARVGWMLRNKLAPGAHCVLEHGGAAPVIVAQDADLDRAVPLLTKGGFYHAGQVCVSVQRVFVHASIADAFIQRLAAEAQALVVGNPLDPATDVGPLIHPSETSRVAQWVLEARKNGADIAAGGERLSDTCYAPTVIVDPSSASHVSQEEVFGPVVCVYRYTDQDEALHRANDVPYAFQAAVFSQDIDRALYCARRLRAAAVMVNDHTAFRADWMPFGGFDLSGLGTGGIEPTFRDMTRRKLYVVRTPGWV